MSEAFDKFCVLLNQLHDLREAGKVDAPETDELRDKMDDLWYQMSVEEQDQSRTKSLERYFPMKGRSVPLSKEAKAAGVQWIMMDGVRNDEEANALEKKFIKEIEHLKEHPEIIAEEQKKIADLREKMKEEWNNDDLLP